MDGSYRLKQSQKQKRVELPEQASTAQRNVQKSSIYRVDVLLQK